MKIKKHILILGGLALVGGALFWLEPTFSKTLSRLRPNTQNPGELPSKYFLKVPFTSQAPYANWGLPYQEACEEASILMIDYFWKKKSFTKAIADKEILKLVEWQKKNLGGYEDTDAEAVVRTFKEYLGYKNVRLIENPTAKQIEEEIVKGKPVYMPAAGRLLGNRYFRGQGPFFHALVVTGYNGKEFTTNDPGTRRGEGYVYSYSTLMKALHDWTGDKETITSGKKRMVVVDPN